MIKISCITEFEKFQLMKPVWDDFFCCSVNQPLFLTHNWLIAWWQAFNLYKNRKLLILEVWEKNKLIGLAPLLRQTKKIKGIPINTISFIENGHTPLADLLFLPEKGDIVISQVLSFLLNKTGNYYLLQLGKLLKGSPTHAAIGRYCQKQKIKYMCDKHRITPLIPTKEKWESFLKSRPTKFRKSLRNKLNRLFRTDGNQIYFDTIGYDVDVDTVISRFCDISRHSWKAKNGLDINSIDGSIQFHKNILHAIKSLGGKAQVWWMKQGETFIAYELHLIYDKTVYPILADYNQSFSNISPGSMVEYHAIKNCFNSPDITAYNTCADDYWYLKNWTSDCIKYDIYNIYPNNIVSNTLFFLKSKILPFLRSDRAHQNRKEL